ncbi:DNA-binding transcriptional regulator LsrR, DeoR family [Poseidonocella pacifica]|uniref:DNA-binding transcriptional regulator LsrR, DeoR family n=1 Tax=Poseidonocella pacifica TaxID=871651 RepID=A0A1I0VCY9_9RHOB|nr:sugar-binding domain-containing protein [Poseidonocella pacifica]SFA73446.1 DNA-binding transcriptional regulator LsrR, DeoR family [Poseidonocella pacifica]
MARSGHDDRDTSPQDDAARAAWLYYVGGLRQDQIAEELGVSRQRAQRLVARAVADGLIRVRIAHPIASCLELERDLRARYGLERARVAPSVPGAPDPLVALAPVAAPELERIFLAEAPRIIALGTGRTLRAVVEQMQTIDAGRHKVVSVIGNVAPDGSASFYEVIMRVADKTAAPHYPMAVPVMARDRDEHRLYSGLPHVRNARALAKMADISIVGVGQIGQDAPLYVDGFITAAELASLEEAGAAGEICGHVFDAEGRFLDHPVNHNMVGLRVPHDGGPVLGIGAGVRKAAAIRAALAGGLLTGLVTDEDTAKLLL